MPAAAFESQFLIGRGAAAKVLETGEAA
jgi:hypothetical protein